mgnify:CR=1 FL=1
MVTGEATEAVGGKRAAPAGKQWIRDEVWEVINVVKRRRKGCWNGGSTREGEGNI